MAAKDSRIGSTSGKGFPIVGIGASAGGLEALQRFLSVLPKDFAFALVFIQHLSAKYKSLLAELLSAKRPSLVIQEISAGLKAHPGRLYLAPPGKEVRLRNGLFQTTVHPEGLIHLPIDEFLASLAEDVAERAIAVIFSGAGTDGARGCRAIRDAGGTVFVQDPATAQFNSMPLAAIAAGQADAVLPPEDICRELLKVQGIGTVMVARDYVIAPEEYDAFFRILLEKTGSRFNHYKKSVVSRRIRRRMYLHGVSTVKDYLDLVSARDAEAASLAADLMIGVTSFFRDRVAWKALNIEVVKKLAAEDTTLPVRVWTPASATGEEAYSITMMLAHELALSGKKREIHVFATDVNDRALEKAREGKYPSSISADVPREYIQKYFTSTEDGQALVVSKEIRECVVVAKQDLLTDPPFSRLDLIVCRNFMIYLEPEAQEKCISLFHYALKDGGYLFLGNAETVGRQNTHFKSVGRKQCRVYQKIEKSPASRLPLSVPYAAERAARPSLSSSAATGHQPSTGIAQEYLLEEFAPAAVAFDQNFEIVFHNGLTHRYLRQPRGIPTHNLLELLPEALRNRIRGAIFRARDEGKPVSIRANVSGDDERKRPVTLRVSRIKENLYVIVFQERGGRATKEEAVPLDTQRIEETAIHQLESELSASRQDLQSHIEQLKSLNEELQSSNEELQAANEELETSREELQSLNEELVTVNSQLQTKIEEQDETNNDLNNFLASTNIPTIFLDQQFRVRRFTPAMLRLVKLLPSDVGRPIVDMSQENLGLELTNDAQTVLDSLVPAKQEIRINGTWYVRTTLPYRTGDNRIAGVVVTYNDVTELKVAEERTRHLASFPQFDPSPVLEVNSSGSIIYSNAATQKVLESLGLDKGNASIFLPHDIDGILRNLEKNVEQTLTREVEVADKVFGETIYVAPQFSAVRIYAFDITERRRAERVVMARLRLAEASTKGALPADEVLRLTLDELEVQTGSKIGFFHFLEKDQETLSLQGWSSNTVATMCSAEGKGSHYNISQAGVWVDCVREKRPVIHNDYASLPHKKGMPNGHAPVIREMVVPIFRGGRIVAIIGVGNKDTDYDESDIEIATYLGDFSWEIVERKRAEEALRESEERLGLFIAHAPAALAMFDRDMRYLSVSRRWLSDYGLGDRDLRGMSHYEVFPEIPETWKAIHRRALAGEVVRSDNDRFDRADGSVQWLQWEVRPWYNAAGAVAGVVVFSEDITERKQAEALISRLAAIVESADDAIISKDLNGVIQSWNIGAEKMFGYMAAEAVGRNISFLVPKGRMDDTPEIIRRIIRGEHIDHFESVRLRKDGTIIPVSLTFSAIKDTDGDVIGVSKIAHDITERKRAEEALRESEERVRRKLDSVLSPEGDIGDLDLSDVIDSKAVQALVDDFYKLARMPMSIIDLKGRMLVGVGWQKICTEFHRVHPETCRNCTESDLQLSTGVPEGEFKLYKCKNNMWDVATPIIVGGRHMGNLFMGQFFFEDEPLDYEFFRAQAGQYGFDEKEYIAALEAVPRLSRDALNTSMAFFLKLADVLSKSSYGNLKLARLLAQRDALTESLRAREDQLKRAQEISHLGSWELDLVSNRLTWSDEVYRIFGLQPQEFGATYEAFLEAIHPDDRAAVDSAYSRSIREGKDTYEIEHRIVRKATGEIRHVHEKCQHFRDETGRIIRSIGMVHDVTERKKAERELERSNRKVSEILASIQDDFYVLDRDWNFVYASRQFTAKVGKEPEDFIGRNIWEMFPNHRGTVLEENFRAAMEKRQVRRFDTGGAYTNAWYRMTAFPSAEGITVLGTDITERKKAEEALRESEERYRSLFGNMLHGFAHCKMLYDEGGRPRDFIYLDVNSAFGKMTGLGNVTGKKVSAVIPGIRESHPELFDIYGRVALTGQPEKFEIEFKPLGLWLSISVYSTRSEHFVAIFDDITERKKAETELLKLSEDMAARNLELESANKEMESFVYSISHDLRAPIRTVAGFAKIIVEDYLDKLDAQGRDYLNRILRGSEKSIQLIDDLLHLSKIARQDMDRVEIDLSSKASKVLEDLREVNHSRNVEIIVQEGLTASADPRLIEIALSNLLENAWKFTSKTADAKIEFGRFVEEGETIYYVKDNGAGFNPEYADKMFWPFHRLHSENEFEGTGIGLAIVERVIRRHGGRVWAKGEVGKGATVYFTLG